MKALVAAAAVVVVLANPVQAGAESVPLIEGFKLVEVASVADAMEQLYGSKAYMTHDMRPLAPAKFAGRAVTVLLKNRPRGLPRPICLETSDAYTGGALGQWPLAFWRHMSPSKNLAQGKLRTQLWWHFA